MKEQAEQAPPASLQDLAVGFAGALTLLEKAADELARAKHCAERMKRDLARAQQLLGAQLGVELQKEVERKRRQIGPDEKVEFWQKVFDVNETHRAVLVATYVSGDWFYRVTNREARA